MVWHQHIGPQIELKLISGALQFFEDYQTDLGGSQVVIAMIAGEGELICMPGIL